MLLKSGTKGEEVSKLQARLGLTPDGNFGPATESKVKEWQSLNQLSADGIVGDQTWEKLFPGSTPEPVELTSGSFKLDNLREHIPLQALVQIADTATKFNITNTLRLAHFLSQCSHESGGFRATRENLNYSPERLKQVFPKYFPGNLSDSYANDPARIGSRIYANRMGNGDEASGEGYLFRGRGYIQLTGKDNYTRFAGYIGEDTVANPDLVATKYALASAAFFFESNQLWVICDRGAGNDIVTAVTKRVNGGTNGLADRISQFKKIYSLLA